MSRLKGCLWLTAGLVVAGLAAAVAFLTLQNAAERRIGQEGAAYETTSVVVAARPVALRSVLVASDVTLKEVPVVAAPATALRDPQLAAGKITLVDLYQGEIIVAERLVDPNVVSGDGRMALVLAEDQVLMAFPADDLMSQVGILKPGDRVDILFTLEVPVSSGGAALPGAEPGSETVVAAGAEEKLATFDLLQSASIAAVVTQVADNEGAAHSAEALLLTVSPQDALTLKYAKDAGGIVDIVLRAPGVEAPFDTKAVDIDYLIDRYRIPTSKRR